MLKRIKNAFDNLDSEAQTDGGTTVTMREKRYSLDSQYRGNTDRAEGGPKKPIDPSVEIDQAFEILKNQRRRYVPGYLKTMDDQVRLGELAEQIAAWEHDKDVKAITSKERKRAYVGLYQCHLPKMDDVGAVSYNKPRGKIESGRNIEQFQEYLPVERSEAERSRSVRSAVEKILPFSSK